LSGADSYLPLDRPVPRAVENTHDGDLAGRSERPLDNPVDDDVGEPLTSDTNVYKPAAERIASCCFAGRLAQTSELIMSSSIEALSCMPGV
jgi:hypothetical protein